MNSKVSALRGEADVFQDFQDRFVAEPKLKTTGTGHVSFGRRSMEQRVNGP